MFLLDLKQAPGIFLDYLSVLYGWKYFHVYFITHCYTVFAWIWIGTTHLLVVAILVLYPFLNGLVVSFVSVEILFNKIAMYSNKPILRIISSKSALKQILKCRWWFKKGNGSSFDDKRQKSVLAYLFLLGDAIYVFFANNCNQWK